MGRFLTVYRALLPIVLYTVVTSGYPQPTAINSTTTKFDDSDMFLEPEQETQETRVAEQQTEKIFSPSEPEAGSQTFIPSFYNYNNNNNQPPPLGHSRPFLYHQQETAYSQRPAAYRQQLNYDNSKYNNPFRREHFQAAAAATDASQALLGSGNFGVIRGGTFYNENDADNTEYSTGRYNNYSPFFHNNGHGRPSFHFGATNPRPQQHEQFANFRDFADINTPNAAYSQYVVVYMNKNGSKVESHKRAEPKNIMERLAMLDLEIKKPKEDISPPKKVSASKRKLALLPLEKKNRIKKITTTPPTDLYEPLLALS